MPRALLAVALLAGAACTDSSVVPGANDAGDDAGASVSPVDASAAEASEASELDASDMPEAAPPPTPIVSSDASCNSELDTPVGIDDDLGVGRTPGMALAVLANPLSGVLTWGVPGSDESVTLTPAAGSSATVVFDVTPVVSQLVWVTDRKVCGVMAAIDNFLSVPAVVHMSSADGALNETWQTTLTTVDFFFWNFDVEVPPGTIQGSFRATYVGSAPPASSTLAFTATMGSGEYVTPRCYLNGQNICGSLGDPVDYGTGGVSGTLFIKEMVPNTVSLLVPVATWVPLEPEAGTPSLVDVGLDAGAQDASSLEGGP